MNPWELAKVLAGLLESSYPNLEARPESVDASMGGFRLTLFVKVRPESTPLMETDPGPHF